MSSLDSISPFSVNARPVNRAELERVALDPQRSVVVEACAGSGKTWLLVARIMRLLLAGAQPGEILAITFTRKAAQEMRERLLQLLEELATREDKQVVQLLQQRGLDSASAEHLLPQARGLLEIVLTVDAPMVIDTFHGWFGRIVRAAPLMSGISPGLTTTERTGELFNEARRDFLSQVNHDENLRAHYIELLHLAGTSTWDLLARVLQRRNEWHSYVQDHSIDAVLDEMAGESGLADVQEDPRRSLISDAEFLAGLREVASCIGEGTDAEKKRVDAALSAIEELERQDFRTSLTADALQNFESLYDAATQLVKFKTNNNPQKLTRESKKIACEHFGPQGDERLKLKIQNLTDQIISANNVALDYRNLALNRAALHCGAALMEAYAAVKQRNGMLDFDDLEWHAAALARNETTAAYVQTRLDGRYKHLLIDEFQDTNPLQWSVLRSWLDAYGEDSARPSVFLVGDPKQSIYRFRRAEPRIFEAAQRFLHQHYGADVLRTNQTRRCAHAIVTALNAALLNAEYPLYAEHTPITTATEGEVWRLPLIPRPEKSVKPDSDVLVLRDALTTPLEEAEVTQHEQEAVQIANVLRGLIGVRTITDERGIQRLAEYRDVLLLVRQRARITPLERALRVANIPYVSDRRGGLLDTLEALDLSALLNFLVVPFADLTLAHVLRTPIFSCSDEDLIALAKHSAQQASTWWSRLQNLSPELRQERPRLHEAHERLKHWLELAGILPVHDLLDRIYHEGRVIERYVAVVPAAMRVQVRANLLSYMELALQLDSGRYPSLPRFIDELQALSQATEQESPDEGITDHGNTARILTVHGAKGLEAPIVVLVDANAESSRNNAWSALIDWPPEDDRPSHFSVFGKKEERGEVRAALFEMDEALAQREDWNLLYVAATRAREVLLISGVTSYKGAGNSWYQRLLAVQERALERMERALPGETDSFESESITVEDFQPRPRCIGQRVAESEASAQDEENEAQRRRGIALHAVLEQQAGRGFDAEQAQRIARARLPEAEAQDIADTAARMLAAPQLRRFFDSSLYLRADNELELLTADGDWMRIDRLVELAPEQGNEVWVLDYKSQHGSHAVPDEYRAQLERYRSVIRALYPDCTVRAGLCFADGVLFEI